jgi:two-component system sensor histidine kinase DesK
VRAVVSRWRSVSFREEWARASATLEAAGIATEATDLNRDLPPELDRVLGFWIREGVTNILRHSQASRCRLVLEDGGDRLRAVLADDGSPRGSPNPAGSGIRGLQERFAALGGEVHAYPTDRGFVLEAILPWSPEHPETHATGNGSVPAATDGVRMNVEAPGDPADGRWVDHVTHA